VFTNTPPIIYDADPTAIHAREQFPKGDARRVMSRSQLCKFAKNPHKWLASDDDERTDAMDFGSMVDVLVTAPKTFDATFVANPLTYSVAPTTKDPSTEKPWTYQATTCKEWREEQEAAGKIVVSHEAIDAAQQAAARVYEDAELGAFIACSQKQALAEVNYTDAHTGIVVPLRIIVDLVPDPANERFGNVLGDLKTTRDAEERSWVRQVFDQGYHWQAAMYLDIYNAASVARYNQFAHLIVENSKPFEIARRILSVEFIEIGRMMYRAALARYCICLSENKWPGYDDGIGTFRGWRVIDPQNWMLIQP